MSKHYTPQELVDGFSQLHTLPEVYFRIKAVVDNPGSQIGDLVREVGTDPALTARILKVVNSPLYAMSGKVETLLRAVNVLGTRAIHDLVLATSVTGMITRRAVGHLDMHEHWRLSLTVGLLARAVGTTCRLVDRDRLFVEGLLSRLGEIVIHERIDALAVIVGKHARNKQIALHHAQRNFLGCHYGDVGAALLRKWHLPDAFCDALVKHLDPATEGEAPDVGILRLAVCLQPAVQDAVSPTALGDMLAVWTPPYAAITIDQVEQILQVVRTEMDAIQHVILPSVTAA